MLWCAVVVLDMLVGLCWFYIAVGCGCQYCWLYSAVCYGCLGYVGFKLQCAVVLITMLVE